MLIDWFTIGAQIINFLILLWLLKHFLFDRVMEAMDRREKRIAARFKEADDEKAEADAARRDYEDKQKELEAVREKKLKAAEQEAEERRESLLEKAREDAQALGRRWRESLENEKRAFYSEFRETAVRRMRRTVEKILADMADADLEQQTVKTFLCRFDDLSEEALPGGNGGPLRIKTSFDLSDDQKEMIGQATSKRLPEAPDIEFETDATLICGIELRSEGRKIAWNLKDYAGELETRIRETIESRTHGSKSESAS